MNIAANKHALSGPLNCMSTPEALTSLQLFTSEILSLYLTILIHIHRTKTFTSLNMYLCCESLCRRVVLSHQSGCGRTARQRAPLAYK
ncbi:hypothetical protein RR46_07254 [Papilio xuthus]|uniref:Uncharacterized protein n=1 Tax=Papilio xuthus TaxID=66420 RepID=A0A194PW03_PAPXU|nr:hypothetical protein RR46_07254 [Papilio xuthus]